MSVDPDGRAATSNAWRMWWVVLPLAIFLAVAVMFAYALSRGDPSTLPSALIGKPVPSVNFPPLSDLMRDGKPVEGLSAKDLSSGQVTVVNFWASWCGPCIVEHPFLVALSQRSGIRLVSVNYKDKPERARAFLERHGNPFLRVGTDATGRGAIEWGVYGMPETFVVDGMGRIVYKHVGPIDAQSLQDKILPAVKRAGRS